MAIYATGLTLADIARRLGGDQPILVDALTQGGGSPTFARIPMRQITGWVEPFTRIVGRPTVAWRRLGAYVAASKSERTPHSEGVFLLSGCSEVDKIRADRDPRGPTALRSEEAWSYLEALGHSLSQQFFYGGTSVCTTAASDGFDGMCARVVSVVSTYIQCSTGSTGDSVYAFKFGPGKFMGIYNVGPSGKLIEANDYGAIVDTDNTGSSASLNELYRTFFNAAFGVAQYHQLAVGRISGPASSLATIDFTNLYAGMEQKPDLFVTTWRGWGCISKMIEGKQSYPPGVTDYTPYAGFYDGIPIIVDNALIADAKMC
ncbi:MAG: hypothetical protein PHO67_08375 [Candidatus Omnitrophica bacterium]|nr:hypothetical protein [Candidatus Omnitrophota bacterium]